jgi:hypothetical protein
MVMGVMEEKAEMYATCATHMHSLLPLVCYGNAPIQNSGLSKFLKMGFIVA